MRYNTLLSLIFIFCCLITSHSHAEDYYWVGGGGTWNSTEITHWSKYSGGVDTNGVRHRYKVPPRPTDNVIFNEKSGFTTNDNTVFIEGIVNCLNMTWNNAPNTPILRPKLSGNKIEIWRNLAFQKDMHLGDKNGNNNVVFQFYSTTDYTIKTNGLVIPVINFEFFGKGKCTLIDDFISEASFSLRKSSLSTGGHNLKLRSLNYTQTDSNPVILDIRNSTIEITRDLRIQNLQDIKASNSYVKINSEKTLSPILELPACSLHKLAILTNHSTASEASMYLRTGSREVIANELTIDAFFTLEGKLTAKKAILKGGAIFSIYANTKSGFSVSEDFQVQGNACTGKMARIKANRENSTAKPFLNVSPSATVAISGLGLRNMTSTTPLSLPNTIDLGENNNITFTTSSTAKDFYWIGGGGDWGDKSHWTTNSSGTPLPESERCVPSPLDNVFFNQNSGFAANDTVNLSIEAFCHDMTWSNAQNTPVITSPFVLQPEFNYTPGLNIYGSLQLQANMTYSVYSTKLLSSEKETIRTNGANFKRMQHSKGVFFNLNNSTGEWDLLDELNTPDVSIHLSSGAFKTNANDISIQGFGASRNTNLNISGSKIDVKTWAVSCQGSAVFSATNSELIVHEYLLHQGSDVQHEKVVLDAPSGKNVKVKTNDKYATERYGVKIKQLISKSDARFEGFYSINELILQKGAYMFGEAYREGGFDIKDSFQAIGTCNDVISFTPEKGSEFLFTIGQTATVTVEYVNTEGFNASRAITFNNSNDFGSNKNVIFKSSFSEETYYWVGGSGSWTDTSHWTKQDGGTYPATDVNCPPSVNTNVVFNQNSGFTSSNKVVSIAGVTFCKDMTWNNAESKPILFFENSGASKLTIFGSLTLQKDMYILKDGQGTAINFNSKEGEILHIKTNDYTFLSKSEAEIDGVRPKEGSHFYHLNQLNFKGKGHYIFDDDVKASSPVSSLYIYCDDGILDFSNRKVELNNLLLWSQDKYDPVQDKKYKTTPKFIVKNASFYVRPKGNYSEWKVYAGSILEGGETCDVFFENNVSEPKLGTFRLGNGKIRRVYAQGNLKLENGGNIIGELDAQKNVFVDVFTDKNLNTEVDVLKMVPSSTLSIGDYTTLVVKEKAYLSGSPCNKINITGSLSNPETSKIDIQGGETEFVNISMKNITAVNPLNLKLSEDKGHNTNVTFEPWTTESFKFEGLGADIANPSYPITLNTDGFYASPDTKIEWGDGSTSNTLEISEPGAYDITVTYPDDCVIRDQIIIGKFKAKPVLNCVRIGNDFISGEGYAGGIIGLSYNGKTYSTTVNENGNWSIPVSKELAAGEVFTTTQSLNGFPGEPIKHTVTVEIGEPKAPKGTAKNVSEDESNDGSINIEGLTGYEYSIDGGNFNTTGVFANLTEGTYTVTARLVDFPKCVSKTLFHIGKDVLPKINCLRAGDTQLSGIGKKESTITIYIASGQTYSTVVQNDNTWLQEGLSALTEGSVVSITQTTGIYPPSRPVVFTVIGAGEPQKPTAIIKNAPSGSIDVNEQSGYEYSLNGKDFNTTANYTNLEAGKYTVDARLVNAPQCRNSQVFEVPNDIPTITPSYIRICTGYTKQLEASVTNGTWSVADATIASVNPKTGMVTANKIGTTTITYTTLKGYTVDCKVEVEGGGGTEPELTPEPPTCLILGDTYSYTFTAKGKQVTVQELPSEFSFKQGDLKVSTLTSNLNIQMDLETASIVADSKGNIFVAGLSQNRTGLILKVSPDGTQNIYAGSETEVGDRDGALSQALLSPISYMTIDSKDNLYVTQGTKVKKINTQTNNLETLADTQGIFFEQTFGLTADDEGNIYFLKASADFSSFSINKITPQGVISEHLTGVKALGYSFQIDSEGSFYIADILNPEGGRIPRIIKVSSTGTTVIAGGVTRGAKDGIGPEAQFNFPNKLIVDKSNNIYVTDMDPNTGMPTLLRKISPTGTVTTINNLQLEGFPAAITTSEGDIVIADANINNDNVISLKKITSNSYTINSKGSVPEGTHSYTLAVSSKCGDSEKIVTIKAGKPIIKNCPDNISVKVSAGETSKNVSWTPPSATDFCGGTATITATHTPNDNFNIGITTVTYTATDKNNNTASCSFTVKVSKESIYCSITSTESEICQGAITQFTARPSGGTWASSATAIATISDDGKVQGKGPGTSLITYTVNGCTSEKLITVNAIPETIKVENENVEVCKLPERTLNLNDYVSYQPQTGKQITWMTREGTLIGDGTQYSTDNLTTGNVLELHYTVTEEICANNVTGNAKLFIKALEEQKLQNKTVRYCYADATRINLNTILKQQASGKWEALTTGIDTNYFNGFTFRGEKAHQNGINKDTNGQAIYKFKFTVTKANKCLNIGDSCIITVEVYE